uniref:Integrase catalytic domain-containing protein n=1 Tax=Cyprinus carpio carpio TaxID=630221 RepID=A0A9J7YC19_CYPCA
MAQLEYLLELDFTIPEISRLLHVSLSTVMRRMKEYRLSVKKTYTQISAEDLKKVVSEFIQQCPNSGYAMVSGYLKSLGIKVTRSTVRETLKAVDPVGTLLRGLHLNFIHRRVYSVPSPLSLWHIDGNHRLIKWRIVIHGGIDGFSRKIMYLKASTNNQAATVLEGFLEAVEQFGLPSRVRSDKGGENVDVARFMLEHPLRGPEKTSYITGRSVHNQRIEHLWRDVWCAVTSNYYAAFQYLQEIGALDPDNEKDLICLHYA